MVAPFLEVCMFVAKTIFLCKNSQKTAGFHLGSPHGGGLVGGLWQQKPQAVAAEADSVHRHCRAGWSKWWVTMGRGRGVCLFDLCSTWLSRINETSANQPTKRYPTEALTLSDLRGNNASGIHI